jgi:hypothetical protein
VATVIAVKFVIDRLEFDKLLANLLGAQMADFKCTVQLQNCSLPAIEIRLFRKGTYI